MLDLVKEGLSLLKKESVAGRRSKRKKVKVVYLTLLVLNNKDLKSLMPKAGLSLLDNSNVAGKR